MSRNKHTRSVFETLRSNRSSSSGRPTQRSQTSSAEINQTGSDPENIRSCFLIDRFNSGEPHRGGTPHGLVSGAHLGIKTPLHWRFDIQYSGKRFPRLGTVCTVHTGGVTVLNIYLMQFLLWCTTVTRRSSVRSCEGEGHELTHLGPS